METKAALGLQSLPGSTPSKGRQKGDREGGVPAGTMERAAPLDEQRGASIFLHKLPPPTARVQAPAALIGAAEPRPVSRPLIAPRSLSPTPQFGRGEKRGKRGAPGALTGSPLPRPGPPPRVRRAGRDTRGAGGRPPHHEVRAGPPRQSPACPAGACSAP